MFTDGGRLGRDGGYSTPPTNPAPSEHSMMGQMAQLRSTISSAESLARQLEEISDRLVGPVPTSSAAGGEVKRLNPGGFAGGIAECNEQLTELFVRINIATGRISSHIG